MKGDLTINRGRTTRFALTFFALDLTGSAIHLHVRKAVSDPAPALALSTLGGGIALSPGTNSVVTITFDGTATAALDSGQYVYDLARVVGGKTEDLFPKRTLTINQPPTQL